MNDEEGYTGEATLVFETAEVPVTVDLRGCFQPIDGRYHWYGRVAENEQVTALVEAGARGALLRTPQGEATGALTDQDPWGRFRVHGISTPPYDIEAPLTWSGGLDESRAYAVKPTLRESCGPIST